MVKKVTNLSDKRKEKAKEETRKKTVAALFEKLKETKEQTMLLLLVQSYVDEIKELTNK